MRVDPLYHLGLTGALDSITGRVNTLSQELSSGLRVASASDDPAAAAESVRLGSAAAADAAYTKASAGIESRLQVTDSALGSVVSQVTAAVALAVKGLNGTLNAADVQAIGAQLSAARDAVLGVANTAYAGSYIFSGTATDTEPFALDASTAPAAVSYAGDSVTQKVGTPAGQVLAVSAVGSAIFTAAGADVLGSLNRLVAEFATGTPSDAAVDDLDELRNGLSAVSTQRGTLGAALNSLQQASSYAATDGANLQAAQSALVSTDTAQVATDLSTTEAQQKALLSVMSVQGKISLFDYLQ